MLRSCQKSQKERPKRGSQTNFLLKGPGGTKKNGVSELSPAIGGEKANERTVSSSLSSRDMISEEKGVLS